jgi:hypothetical protein
VKQAVIIILSDEHVSRESLSLNRPELQTPDVGCKYVKASFTRNREKKENWKKSYLNRIRVAYKLYFALVSQIPSFLL